MRKLFLFAAFLMSAYFVSADLVVTEVMYHPSAEQGGNYNEWVEVYNHGPEFELSGYYINGKLIQPYNISSQQVFVIAEKLVGNGSLDSYYGNNDGVWDSSDPFFAVDTSSFSLDDASGVVNVSSSLGEVMLSYDSSLGASGNGKTLERLSLDSDVFSESSSVGGSPGFFYTTSNSSGSESNVTSSSEGSVAVEALIANAVPVVLSIDIDPDDSPEPGVQIYPVYNDVRLVNISAVILDDNSISDLSDVVLNVVGKPVELVSIEDLNNTAVRYSWLVRMNHTDLNSFYDVNLTVGDVANASAFSSSGFYYSEILSISVSSSSLSFGSIVPGSSSLGNITLRNNGNSPIDLEVSSTNLTNGANSILSSSLELFVADSWMPLSSNSQLVDSSIPLSSESDLSFKFNAPLGFRADRYSGTITLAALRG